MALIVEDRVMESSITTGTGAMTLAGNYAGFRAFSGVCSVSDTFYYLIEAIDTSGVATGDWETGLGTYSGASTLTRTTVSRSSNSNSAVSFTAGTKRVSITANKSYLSTLGSTWKIIKGPLDNEAPASGYATLDTRNAHPLLAFNDTTLNSAVFTSVLPSSYANLGITVILYWAAATATTGNVMWQAALEDVAAAGQNIGSDGFATAQAFAAASANATNGLITKSVLNISNGANMASIAAGDLFRLKIIRDAANAADTMVGNSQLLHVMVVGQ